MRKHLAMTAVAVTIFLAIAVPAVAQDVSGVWEASFEGRQGARTLAITLAQDGMHLTGSAQMPRGEGIVSELFSFTRSGGDVDYALRPEFTPTLARMAAAKGRSAKGRRLGARRHTRLSTGI